MKTSKGEKWAIGAVFAAIAGYVAGILTAPKSGKETREDIKNKTSEEVSKAEAQLQKVGDELDELIGKAKEQLADSSEKAKGEMTDALTQAKDAKAKTKKLLLAAKNGEAEDDEVSRLVKDATKTIKHLKQYYKG